MNMKECPGIKDLCCNPICDWEEYCDQCKKQMGETMTEEEQFKAYMIEHADELLVQFRNFNDQQFKDFCWEIYQASRGN